MIIYNKSNNLMVINPNPGWAEPPDPIYHVLVEKLTEQDKERFSR
jgi:hypothetical protein